MPNTTTIQGIPVVCPYEFKYIAKMHGGKWDKLQKTWKMPNEAAKQAVLTALRNNPVPIRDASPRRPRFGRRTYNTGVPTVSEGNGVQPVAQQQPAPQGIVLDQDSNRFGLFVDRFRRARDLQGIIAPTVTFTGAAGYSLLKLTLARDDSSNPNHLYVKAGTGRDGYLGKITPMGWFYPSRDVMPEQVEVLSTFLRTYQTWGLPWDATVAVRPVAATPPQDINTSLQQLAESASLLQQLVGDDDANESAARTSASREPVNGATGLSGGADPIERPTPSAPASGFQPHRIHKKVRRKLEV